jgi:hypothetical protein
MALLSVGVVLGLDSKAHAYCSEPSAPSSETSPLKRTRSFGVVRDQATVKVDDDQLTLISAVCKGHKRGA